MPSNDRLGRLSLFALCVSLVVVLVVFGVRAAYSSGVYYALAAIQFSAVCLAAWRLGARAIRLADEQRRMLAVAGGLLVAALALFSLLPGVGPPGLQGNAENQLRYLILLINTIAVAGGFIVLAETLRSAGERFFSTLGLGAIMIAAPVYLIWAALMLAFYRAAGLASTGEVPEWITSHSDFSDLLLFFGGLLTYLATAAIATSFGRAGWLSWRATYIFVSASFLAVLLLVTRGLGFPNPAVAFAHWYTIPGWVAGIPAVPWVMPCIFGIILLRRTGNINHEVAD